MDRRIFIRVPLDVPSFALLRMEQGQELVVMIRDISKGGAQVGLPPNLPDPRILLNCLARLTGLPSAIDPLEKGCLGQITWVNPTNCGMRFANSLPIAEEALQEFCETL